MADHILVFIKHPFVAEPVGVRVQSGLIIDSDPRMAFAQGRSILWLREFVKRRPGWSIVREQELPDSPPIEMLKRDD